MKNKKAYFFSLDALIALVIILGIVFFVKPHSTQIPKEMKLQEDILEVLSSIKIGEINNSYVHQLIANGGITDFNQSVLEQIGEFYANSNPDAQILAQSILDDLNFDPDVGIYFNGLPIAISGELSPSDADNMWVSRQIISGVQEGNSLRGYSSRAFLFSENKIDYFYFGGYVGDGNITIKLKGNIIGVNIEGAFSGPFDLYINDVLTESHNPSVNVPYKANLTGYLSLFSAGDNYIEFKSSKNLYIAGGYVRVVYNLSADNYNNKTDYLPGIDGIINLYSGFYAPGNLNKMEIFLHYNSLYEIFLNIGNTRVYTGNSDGSESSITLNNSFLSGILDYPSISQKTIPYRLGIMNVSYFSNGTTDSDIFSVTDISGSMEECVLNCTNGTSVKIMDLARAANKAFVDVLLSFNRTRVGMIGYETRINSKDYHPLSRDKFSLKSLIDMWKPGGGTCICCGVNRAVQGFLEESNYSVYRSMVVFTDGRANVKCPQQGTGDASQDAIKAACEAYNNHNISVHTVGFGLNADEITLQSMASCGRGNYYFSTVEELVEIYVQLANDILNASYLEQTVLAENFYTKLYPDSYIKVDYTRTVPYGMVITAETPEFGNNISQGILNIPDGTIPYEVEGISYSGSKWTDNVEIYNNSTGLWESVFNLFFYNLSYIGLGDPYAVNIPVSKINPGDNLIRISTGLSSANSTGGSQYNKLIYSVVKNISSYSPIVSSAKGCKWVIEFEDGTNSTIFVPVGYSGGKTCYYTQDNIAFDNNDAIDNSIFNLLSDLDLNSNRKIESKFSENDITIDSVEITGIPFTWETEVQVRVWR